MSLENEYYNEKQLLKNAQEKISKMESLDVENMTQEQLEARERVIKGAKEDIKESEELLEEIKEELVEFINNGGEVSEKTKEEINYFESYDVSFKVVSNRNNEVYVEGYVTINDEEAEDVDWYFWDGSQYSSQRKIHHDGIQITGSTVDQEHEIWQFESDFADDGIGIDECILQSDDDENRTYRTEHFTVITTADFSAYIEPMSAQILPETT